MDQTLRQSDGVAHCAVPFTEEVMLDIEASAAFNCPRCGTSVSQRFYGPCEPCCVALRAKFLTVGRDVDVAEYVPKMNVTPNAVALKDD